MTTTSFTLPSLYAIANLDSLRDPAHFVKILLRSGVQLLQLRDKSGDTTRIREVFAEIRSELSALNLDEKLRPRIIINDLPQLCLELGADGVHLGQDDLAPREARNILGPKAIIGLSTHNVSQVAEAPIEDLEYLGLGPIFESKTKQGHAPTVGLERLREAVKKSKLPIVAIGGIVLSNAAAVFETGASCVAAISDLEESKSLEATVRAYDQCKRGVG